jgi:DNA-3-methyladenine glycosylase II
MRVDGRWRERIRRIGACTLKPNRDRLGVLARAIVGQQISAQAARAIEGRLLERLGGRYEPGAILGLGIAGLRDVGLSARKAGYVWGLAEAVATGRLPLERLGRWKDERIVEALVAWPGIGRWTAEMFLVFGLGRPDVWAVDDLGVRAGVQRHYGLERLPKPAECRELGEAWRPYRSVAMWYFWREGEAERSAGGAS